MREHLNRSNNARWDMSHAKSLMPSDELDFSENRKKKAPLNFSKFRGMKGKLYLPKGVEVQYAKNRVSGFKIGTKTFTFSRDKGKYCTDDGTVYELPEVQFETPKFDFMDEVPRMQAVVNVSNAKGSDGLQMIQTDYTEGSNDFTRRMDRLGMNNITDDYSVKHMVFVDGGKNSVKVLEDKNKPEVKEEDKAKPSHPDYPYYYTEENLSNKDKSNHQWNPETGAGSIILYDKPSSTTISGLFTVNRFETSAIIRNWLGCEVDLIVGSFSWACQTPKNGGKPKTNFMEKEVQITEPTSNHLKIISMDYPDYTKSRLLPNIK